MHLVRGKYTWTSTQLKIVHTEQWSTSILASNQDALGSYRFDDGWILRRLHSNFIHVRMRQIFPPSVLPMLQHAKGLTTVVVRTQCLVSYHRRSRPSCKSKAPYCGPGGWGGGGWGHLHLKLDIILIKKIHVIRVVFQDQAMYERTLFRDAKTCKIGKKGVFLVIVTNFGKDMMDKLRKMHAKMHI